MLNKINKPFQDIRDAINENKTALVIEGNTNDRFIGPEIGIEHPMTMICAIYKFLNNEGYSVGNLSISEGFRQVTTKNQCNTPDNKKALFTMPIGNHRTDYVAYLSQLLSELKRIDVLGIPRKALIIETEDFRIPNDQRGMETQDERLLLGIYTEFALSDAFRASGNVLILFTKQGAINRSLTRSGAFRLISIPAPSDSERRCFLQFLRNHRSYGVTFPNGDILEEELVNLCRGARLIDIEGVVKKRLAENLKMSRTDINEIKRKSINEMSMGQLEAVIPDESITLERIIGLDHIKRNIKLYSQLWSQGSRSIPQVLIWTGPPGTGKSHMFQAAANESDCLGILFKNQRNQYVGASEARMEQTLELIKTNEKVMVFVDEIDQMMGRSTNAGDGGVDARLFGMLLAATGDAAMRGKVMWVFCTNRIDLLDSALLDRAGAILVFLPPCAREREKLICFIASEMNRLLDSDVDTESLSREHKLQGVSVRNLIDIISQAGIYSDLEKNQPNSTISYRHLKQAIRMYNQGDLLEVEYLTLLSLSYVRFLDQLPWIDGEGKVNPDYDFPPYLRELVDEQGNLDSCKLSTRLQELNGLRLQSRMTR